MTASADRPTPDRVSLDVSIRLANLSLKPVNAKWKGEIDVLLSQRNETGDVFDRVNDTIQMDLSDATYRRFQETGVPYRKTLALDPKATLIRVVVRDPSNGNLGSLTIPVDQIRY